MHKLRLFILVFFITTSVPLLFFIWQSYSSLAQEEQAQIRYFAETLFDQLEQELAELIQQEELRAVDEYQYHLATSPGQEHQPPNRSPLSEATYPPFILGYLQNNPDGSLQTPLGLESGEISGKAATVVEQLRQANELFNTRKFATTKPLVSPDSMLPETADEQSGQASFAARFLKQSQTQAAPAYLGRKQQRVEEVPAEQVLNITRDSPVEKRLSEPADKLESAALRPIPTTIEPTAGRRTEQELSEVGGAVSEVHDSAARSNTEIGPPSKFEVEVAPFQSVALENDQVYVFRRIVIDNEIYRQGFIVLVRPLLEHLAEVHFASQPLATFTELRLQRRDLGTLQDVVITGGNGGGTRFISQRVFPPPFDFVVVNLSADAVPSSPARRLLNVALAVFCVFMFLGMLVIYQSTKAIVRVSERRSQFVSSVTHELKTPLTNIQMYIEMLDQGIAATPEREQEYLAIMAAESGRLSRLINNVLELGKLERKQRHYTILAGNLDDVLDEVRRLMSRKISQEGFELQIHKEAIPAFPYDKEVLVQILVNLIDNSLKFGKHSERREINVSAGQSGSWIRLAVSDTGPGIPARALKNVFDDFYRVDNKLTRATGGTGIGLALVKKFTIALGGRVKAINNNGPGCTIIIELPCREREMTEGQSA